MRHLTESEAKALRPGSDHYTAYVGPPQQYDFMGATQFRLLCSLGLREHHRVLDFGCGSLRAGRLLITYLNPNCYYGIEPNSWLVEEAVNRQLGRDALALKCPTFSHTDSFTADEFAAGFDFIVAQSIFSHAGPDLTSAALASFKRVLAPNGIVLATFIHGEGATPNGWLYPGCVTYRKAVVSKLLTEAGLVGQPLRWFHPRQTWWIIAHDESEIPPATELKVLTGAVLREPEFGDSIKRSKVVQGNAAAPGLPKRLRARVSKIADRLLLRLRNGNGLFKISAVDASSPKSLEPSELTVSKGASVYYDTAKIAASVEQGKHREAIGGAWEELGRLQLDYMVDRGLSPEMTLVDIGCGSLRAGVHFVDYLAAGNYFGTDINESLMIAGYERELSPELQAKLPRSHLITDAEFDFCRLPRPVDRAIAQSVFTHLPLNHVRLCLTRLADAMRPGGQFFATFFECPQDRRIDEPIRQDPGGRVTTSTADPYHYRATDFAFAAATLPWEMEYVGDWGHPRAQRMICFHRL